MKKQYIFLLPTIIMLYIIYLIIDYKYREYTINSHIEYIVQLNVEIRNKIQTSKEIIDYKQSSSYINKILKEEQGMKNKGENVIYLTTEDTYKKYTQDFSQTGSILEQLPVIKITDNMTTKEKWIYFLFKKDIR